MELHQERTTTHPRKTMKAIVHERYGMPDVLELRDIDVPVIADDQVLLRVHAASLNPAEWYGVTGPFFVRLFGSGLRKPKSTKVGADVAGVVEVVGKDVTEFQPGDEVFGTAAGSWAEYAPAREVRLVPKPANVSFEEAAAVPIAAITALQALRTRGRPARTEGADQRRFRRRRHLRRPDREGAGRGRDRCVQHEERRPRPLARSRPRRRLQPGGLHAAQRAPRADDRHRREPAVQEVQARVDTWGDGRRGRGEVPVQRRHRAAVARARNASGRAWAGARRSSSSSPRSTRTTSSSCAS